MELTKEYRIAYNESKVILIGKFTNSKTGCTTGFEADTKAEINTYISENELVLTDELQKMWDEVE